MNENYALTVIDSLDENNVFHSSTKLLNSNPTILKDNIYLLVFHVQFNPISRVHMYKKVWKNYDGIQRFVLGTESSVQFSDGMLWLACCKGRLFEMCEFLADHSLHSVIVHTKHNMIDGQNCCEILQRIVPKQLKQRQLADIYPLTNSIVVNHMLEMFSHIMICTEDGEGIRFTLYKGKTGD